MREKKLIIFQMNSQNLQKSDWESKEKETKIQKYICFLFEM